MLFIATSSLHQREPLPGTLYFDYTRIETPFYEYSIQKEIFESFPNLPFFGVISERFSSKCNIEIDEFVEFIDRQLQNGYRAAVINPFPLTSAMFDNSFQQAHFSGHSGLHDIANELGILEDPNEFQNQVALSYCQYAYFSREVWREYFEFVDGVMEVAEKDLKIRQYLGETGTYQKNKNVSLWVFLIERLFGQFLIRLNNKDLIVFDDKLVARRKYGNKYGAFLRLKSERDCFENSRIPEDYKKWHESRVYYLKNPEILPLPILEEPNRAND